MPLLQKISEQDTWPELEAAAQERFWDGLALAIAAEARSTGAVYLLGYVAEMLLKTAYYRVRGLSQLNPVDVELHNIRRRSRQLGFVWAGNLHTIQQLATLLVEERKQGPMPLDPIFSVIMQGHVAAIAQDWDETLRYKHVHASEVEVASVFSSVDWLIQNYASLWS